MTTTTQLRNWWSPACADNRTTARLFGSGSVNVRTTILVAVAELNEVLRAHNYRTREEDTGGFNCRPITGGTTYSLHAYGIALDINWTTNPYGPNLVTDMPRAMINDILAIRTKNGKQVWRWGGDYAGNKDAMHFEICCSPADIATGIATPTHGDDDMTPEEKKMLQEVHSAVIGEKSGLYSILTVARETRDLVRRIVKKIGA